MSKKPIYILGYSGHAFTVIDTALSMNRTVLGYFENTKKSKNPFDLNYLGIENNTNLKSIITDSTCFPAIGNNVVRKKLISLLSDNNIKQEALIHQNAVVNRLVEIETSTLVNAGAVINSLSKIGKGCIINTNVTIEHECTIGDYSHIAPGATILGNVSIEENCFIGANATIKQGLKITRDVIIGAGSVVLEDIKESGTWVGNPAKRIK